MLDARICKKKSKYPRAKHIDMTQFEMSFQEDMKDMDSGCSLPNKKHYSRVMNSSPPQNKMISI